MKNLAKYVLISDETLIHDYRNFPLMDFLACAPDKIMPNIIYGFLEGRSANPTADGRLQYAPYGLRKIEASLLKEFSPHEVVVAHPDYFERFIKDDTEVIGIYTMDPLGYGPTTMSYYTLFKQTKPYLIMNPFVRKRWESLITRINRVRKGKKAKLIVGGPGVWEYMLLREEADRHKIDYLVQGEMDDVASALISQIGANAVDYRMFSNSYVTYNDSFQRVMKEDHKFISRGRGLSTHPKLENIPDIVHPSTKGLQESMRGCGIGCDFCEVTLRELRYYPIEKIIKELKVNVNQGGFEYAWIHSDEIFAYKHLPMYVPNQDALIELFTEVMKVKGVTRTNPTHGRISIPAGFPELFEKLHPIIKGGPSNWIGLQVGIETGSESLAKKHMPAKTLPLKVGVDGSWQEIVWRGLQVMNKYWWRPAFTLQVGQRDETDEDNWETVALINRLSNSYVDGRPFEFTATPLLNVPLGKLKAREIDVELSASMLAVYYVSYRHLAKMAARDSNNSRYKNPLIKYGVAGLVSTGGLLMYKYIERLARRKGVDIEKAKRYGIGAHKEITTWSTAASA